MNQVKNVTPAINKQLLQVSQAQSYRFLEQIMKTLDNDFSKIKKQDQKGITNRFYKRFLQLKKEAHRVIKQNVNGEIPPCNERALFGEMVLLRDICITRLEKQRE
ncbi:MAG: hypothetical protein U9O98_09305 [Asgard group archaeon]|nr:hypothetical protein [Asgard group archaeon]